MINYLLRLSIQQRWLVVAIVIGLCVLGGWSYLQLPIDAVPDITNVQVQVNTEASGYSPLEAEQRITFSHRDWPGRAAQSRLYTIDFPL